MPAMLCELVKISLAKAIGTVVSRTYSAESLSPGASGFSRIHFSELLSVTMTSSLVRSSYGHWAKLHTSHRATPKDLVGWASQLVRGKRGRQLYYNLHQYILMYTACECYNSTYVLREETCTCFRE